MYQVAYSIQDTDIVTLFLAFKNTELRLKLLMDRLGDDVIIHNQKLNGLKQVL